MAFGLEPGDLRLILVGPMGAGKSTIGRLIARELDLDFKDSDREIENRSGADIPWIFDVEGEAGFRDREAAIIAELTQLPRIVLATGGGAVLREENRRLMKTRGIVIYLYTSVDQQLERTSKDKNRPLLQVEQPREVLEKLMAERAPLYQEACDLSVRTDQRKPRTVAHEIVAELKDQGLFPQH